MVLVRTADVTRVLDLLASNSRVSQSHNFENLLVDDCRKFGAVAFDIPGLSIRSRQYTRFDEQRPALIHHLLRERRLA